jgi:GNAT superfamily N-acetyltransferase
MNWYEKLNQYFPIEEMKSKEHMELLLKEKADNYHKDEGPNHVMMYVETDDFVFVDYLFVSTDARGQGLGKKLLNQLKQKGKPIILEVEPVDYEDTIGYSRRSLATNEVNELEILYWSPTNESEKSIFEKMKHTYENIHTYKDKELYGQSYQDVDEVLTYEVEKDQATL